jgi:uncharacterized protein (UPF0333 family)
VNKIKNPFFLVFFAVMLFASIALAEVVQTSYRQLRGTAPAADAAQTTISAVQTSIWSTTPINAHAVNGNPRVVAHGSFSNASATCTVTCMLYFKSDSGTYTRLGFSKVGTLTASATDASANESSSGRYFSVAPVDFDTFGANYYEIRVRAISAGDVTVVHYPIGSGTRDGE